MEPIKKINNKWVIFGAVIAILAIIILIGPIIVKKHFQSTIQGKTMYADVMLKVRGTIMQSAEDGVIYLKGDNGLYYILFGDKSEEMLENLGKNVSVFGAVHAPFIDEDTVDGHPLRMKLDVANIEF